MKALEANQLAMDSCKYEIDEFLRLIKESAERGETELTGIKLLKGGTRSHLVNLGYEVESRYAEFNGERRVPLSFKITWNKIE